MQHFLGENLGKAILLDNNKLGIYLGSPDMYGIILFHPEYAVTVNCEIKLIVKGNARLNVKIGIT